MGIGAAGTVGTGQTAREKNAAKALGGQAISQAVEESQATASTQDVSQIDAMAMAEVLELDISK
jgi:hypothetical protein